MNHSHVKGLVYWICAPFRWFRTMDAFTQRLLRRTDSIRTKGNGTSADRKRKRLQLILDAVVRDALPLVAVELPDCETPVCETEVHNFSNNSFVVAEKNATTRAESPVQYLEHEIVGKLDGEDVCSGYSHFCVGPPGERVERSDVWDHSDTPVSGSGGSRGSRISSRSNGAEWGDSRSDGSSSCGSSSDAGQAWSGRDEIKQAWAAMMCGNPQLKMGEQILLAHEVCEVDCHKEEVGNLHCNKLAFDANLHQEMEAETVTVAETGDQNELRCFPAIHSVVKHEHVLEPDASIEAVGGCEEKSESHISQLLKKQKAMLVQVSKVVELCKLSTPGASEERAEAERHLLLANQQYKALLGEVDRLKNKRSECSISSGELTLTDITLPLRSEFVAAIEMQSVKFWFVCLAIHRTSVVSTTATCELGNNMLYFAGPLCLKGLDENFKVLLNVYSLRLNREKFQAKKKLLKCGFVHPQLVNPVLEKSQRKLNSTTKIRKCKLFPIGPKTKNNKTKKMILPQTYLTHSSAFTLVGSLEFSAANMKHQVWQLTKVTACSPLSGIVHITLKPSLCSINVNRTSFLSVLEETANGTLLWHYQWCHLQNFSLCFWNYPSDADLGKLPLKSVDLRRCASHIAPAPRELCARPHSFLVETCSCQPLPSVATTTHVDERHIFSANSKREMQDWCELLNNIVSTIKLWNSLEG